MFNLSGKVAVVTGGGSGIGRAISTLFGRQGAHVMVLDVDDGAANETAAEIARAGGTAHGAPCDVSNAAAVKRAFDTIVGREEQVLQELAAYQPMGRMGTPEEVAALALYLCSDEASFVTGQAYPLDGGVLNQ